MAVVARFDEDVEWLHRAPIAYTIVNKSTAVPNEGYDASSFLWFIVDRYGLALPEFTLFMHAHERSWHHAQYSQLASMLIAFEQLPNNGFLSVSHGDQGQMLYTEKEPMAELSHAEHQRLRRDIIGLDTPLVHTGGRVRFPACAQFWVRRDRILSHPRSYYERLYKVMVDGRHPLLARFAAAEGYPSRHLHNLFLEAHWHWIFGEPERYQPPFELYSHLPFVTGVVPDVTGSVPEWMRRRAAMRYWGPGQQKGLSAAAGWDKGGRRPCSRPCDRCN